MLTSLFWPGVSPELNSLKPGVPSGWHTGSPRRMTTYGRPPFRERGQVKCQTGPDIVGQTPVRLSKRFNPSQTFTALMAFREDPERARSAFRHPPDNLPRPRAT